MNKAEMFWQTYLNLEKELLEVAKYIYITDEKLVYSGGVLKKEKYTKQLDVFSPLIADLIVRTCIEIEAVSKELYFELGGTKTRGDKDLFFDEDCLKLIDMKCKSSKKIVMIACSFFNLTDESNRVFKPLKEAHKRQGTDWERAYQAVKHDRYSSVSSGTIKNFIHALGALYLLNIYYRNEKINTKFLETNKLDFSFGSKVFSLKKPDMNKYTVDVVNGKTISGNLESDDSPYIFKYTDSSYHQILEANKRSVEMRMEYINSQPELKEPEFQQQLKESYEREKIDKQHRMIIAWELCKYRINKRLPASLPFEIRKKLFIESREFNGRIRTKNKHKSASEITEENIQSEIDLAGDLAGMELEQVFDNDRMIKSFNNGYCELVIDNGDVKYN